MKRILSLLCLLLLLAGCSAPSQEQPDYQAFFQARHPRSGTADAPEEVILTYTPDYVLVHYTGTGPSLQLYKVSTDGPEITVLASASEELAISGCMSLNYLEDNGRHIYFGNLRDTHWDPASDTVSPAPWYSLEVPDSTDTLWEFSLRAGEVFLLTLDAPLTDFQARNAEGEAFLDLETYLAQGYSIHETAFAPVQN